MTGRLVADVRSFPSGCSVLLEVDRVEGRRAMGSTELQLADCSALLQQGWHVRARGELRRPMPGAHPLLPGSAERLARQGSWSRLRVDSIDVLRRPWTPLADLRRDVAKRLPLAGMALLLFICLAGAQPSVVRAVLMAVIALMIRESGHRSRPLGVLVVTLSGMLLLRPVWAQSIGFQLSAAATAGLILTAPRLEQALQPCLPDCCWGMASALSIPVAALLWTLPLQLLHFGAMPLYALSANLLVAPLLAPLTLLAMLSALLVLLLPPSVLPVLLWPVQQMAGLLIAIASWIGHWPGAQLLTGRPQLWVIALLVVGLLPWLLWAKVSSRSWALVPMASALFFHGLVQFGDGLVAVKRFGRHWLLARHLGRAALVSTHGDARSCRMAQRIAAVHGHARLHWAVLLDPVATDVLPCWQELAHRVEANQQGRAPIAMGKVLRSDGLSVQRFQHRAGSLVLRVGQQRWLLLPMPQVFWTLQAQQGSGSQHVFAGIWLGFKPSAPQRRWLLQHWAGSRFIGL